jgi:hypothetical protein
VGWLARPDGGRKSEVFDLIITDRVLVSCVQGAEIFQAPIQRLSRCAAGLGIARARSANRVHQKRQTLDPTRR